MDSTVERFFVLLVEERRKARGLTLRAVAQATWPHMTDPDRRYRLMRTAAINGTRIPRLGLGECIAMARAVGEEPSMLLWEAMSRMAAQAAGSTLQQNSRAH